MEKAKNIVCGKLAVQWNDVGSWDSVFEIFPKDSNNNAVSGDVEMINVKDSLVISTQKLTTLIGVSDIAVIETDDAILVSDRKQAQSVKEMVALLKDKKRKEVDEHTTTYRPWGKYTILEESEHYKIKKITVNPGATLSLQKHKKRSEHWVVVKGVAQVRIGEEDVEVKENQSAYVPKGVVHRLGNTGAKPLEIIEVQNGDYVGEDDIERLEDNYGRVK
jgi:mannose-1-phosphate guanylyltransferase / mannose-6-phosphate isomerase